MSIIVDKLAENSPFVKRHKRKFEFVFEMSWWVLLWIMMISHAMLLYAECPVLYDLENQIAFCNSIANNTNIFSNLSMF